MMREEQASKRASERAPLAGAIWKCWSNISFRLDSAILLSASRRLPLSLSLSLALRPEPHPRERARTRIPTHTHTCAAHTNGNGVDRVEGGGGGPIEDLQTRCRRYRHTPSAPLSLPLCTNSASQPASSFLVLCFASSSLHPLFYQGTLSRSSARLCVYTCTRAYRCEPSNWMTNCSAK